MRDLTITRCEDGSTVFVVNNLPFDRAIMVEHSKNNVFICTIFENVGKDEKRSMCVLSAVEAEILREFLAASLSMPVPADVAPLSTSDLNVMSPLTFRQREILNGLKDGPEKPK